MLLQEHSHANIALSDQYVIVQEWTRSVNQLFEEVLEDVRGRRDLIRQIIEPEFAEEEKS